MRRLLALLVSLTVAIPAAAAAQGGQQGQLDRAKARLDEITARIERAEGEAAAAEEALADADERLREVEEVVNDVAAAIERQRLAVSTAEQRLADLRAEAATIDRAFATRAADVYKSGSGLPFELVLASGDVQQAIDRSSFLRVITAADRATLEDVQNSRVRVEAQQERFDAERTRLERMLVEQQDILAQVEELRRSRALAAAEARSAVAELNEEHDDLEADVKRIERLIAERKVSPVSGALPSTEGYIWPRCDRVTSEFGRRWGRLHAGIDIDGDTGDLIGASKAGVVIYAGWQGGYGRLTLIDHGDGVVTAYGHQSAILVGSGQRVERGERIGRVGSTGHSTGSHLHFETRVNGSPTNPRRFLPPSC